MDRTETSRNRSSLHQRASLRSRLEKALCVLLAISFLGNAAPGQEKARPYSPGRLRLQDALDTTLDQHPTAEIQRLQVQIAQGLRTQAAGQFDTVLAAGLGQSLTNDPITQSEQLSAQQSGITATRLAGHLANYGFSQTKQLRDGISFTSSLGSNRATDNLTNPLGLNTSRVSLGVTVPLLRGWGRNVVVARERAANLEVSASVLDLNQITSQLLANTASSYWTLVAASKALAIAEASERRGQTYVDNVQALIDADKAPRSDIYEVKANLADRSAARFQAQQVVVAAQQQLALDMGLVPSDLVNALTAIDDFPDASSLGPIADDPEAIQEYVAQSLDTRADYLASRERITEAKALALAAKDQTRPQLDLNFSTGYLGLAEGRATSQFLNATVSGIRGMDSTAGITYSFPVQNHVAEGQARQAEAALKQAQLRSSEIVRQVSFALKVATEAVLNAKERVSLAAESVKSFEAALSGEQEKYRLGSGSVVNILTLEDKLTTALSNELQAQLALALALTQLRLASGSIAPGNQPIRSVDSDLFRKVPFAHGTRNGR